MHTYLSRVFRIRLAFIILILSLFQCATQKNKKLPESYEKSEAEIHSMILALSRQIINKDDADRYPVYYGIDIRNKKDMIIIFQYNEQKPELSLYLLIYKKTNYSECVKLHGNPLFSTSMDSYIGCEPGSRESISQ